MARPKGRPRNSVPSYKFHKRSGQAVCYINRQTHYLGAYDSPESHKRYAELIAGLQSEADQRTAEKPITARRQRTINELALKFTTERLPEYSDAEQHCIRTAMRVMCDLFGETLVDDFGPLRLRAVRSAMIQGDLQGEKPRKPWSRGFTNKQVKRLKMLFRWGVSWELVPVVVADALATLASLAANETDAAESKPRRAVSAEDIAAVRAAFRVHRCRDILDLLLLTGARPGELLNLTTGDIDRRGDVWRAELKSHKTRHKGKSRVLLFNVDAQRILTKYLQANPSRRLFGVRRDSFSHTLKSACKRAGVEPFVPHEMRHTVATRIADELGTEAAQRLLGHCQAAMTMHYSKGAERVASEAARTLKIGG